MKIGAVSAHTGLSVHAIRYYEKQALLRAPVKDASGHRQYSGKDVELLDWILCMKNSGMSLKHIRQYANAFYQDDAAQCLALLQEHQKKLTQQQQDVLHYLAVTQNKIKKLQQRLT
jgi:MerR family transcriptional regulator, aldehyde-responsive regulator